MPKSIVQTIKIIAYNATSGPVPTFSVTYAIIAPVGIITTLITPKPLILFIILVDRLIVFETADNLIAVLDESFVKFLFYMRYLHNVNI